MTLSDEIRWYTIERHVEPARHRGLDKISIRAGDVHKAMGLTDRLPAVCSALGTIKFLEVANLELLRRTGPSVSTTTMFHFKIL